MPDVSQWVTLYNPAEQATHQVPDNPGVIQHFRDRGWETGEDTVARVAAEAQELHGKELDKALEAEGLPTDGKVAEKQARLAQKQAESATPTEGTEGVQG